MNESGLSLSPKPASIERMKRMLAVGAVTSGLLGGCVNVTAPDKPIVINLNISITQEIVYRLDGEAKTLIQKNPGIF